MEETVCIEQQGTVEEVVGHRVFVRIRQISACGACHAKSFCSMAEIEDKLIETNDNSLTLAKGDPVKIIMKRSMGNKAVLLGYVIPFVLMITILLTLSSFSIKDWINGVISIGILVPYYFTLYLLRDRLKKSFTFTLSKID